MCWNHGYKNGSYYLAPMGRGRLGATVWALGRLDARTFVCEKIWAVARLDKTRENQS